MDINKMDQGLLKRNPALTPAEFSHHWYHVHAPLVIPFFLHSGTQHYEQARPHLPPSPHSPLNKHRCTPPSPPTTPTLTSQPGTA